MTRGRIRLLASACVFLIALLILFAVLKGGASGGKQTDVLLPDLTADQIAGISWTFADGGEVCFAREEGVWYFAEPGNNGPVPTDRENLPDQSKVSELAASFTGVGVSQVLDDPGDGSEYGLAEPSSVIMLRDAAGETYEIRTGSQNDMTKDVYCALGGEKSVIYAVKPAILSMADCQMEDYQTEE